MQDEEPKRHYQCSDGEAITRCKTKLGYFIARKDKFIAFDPDYADPYADNVQLAITAAEEVEPDASVRSVQAGITESLNQTMEQSKECFHLTMHFVIKAFGDNIAVRNEFGESEFDKVRNNQPKLARFMKNLYAKAKKYSSELIEKKYTMEQIEEINTLADRLSSLDVDQESKKKTRNVSTADRINILNKPWNMISDICRDGKTIFADDAVTRKLFTLSTDGGGTPPPTDTPDTPTK